MLFTLKRHNQGRYPAVGSAFSFPNAWAVAARLQELIGEDKWADDADGEEPFEFGKQDGEIDLIPVCDEVNLAWQSRRAVAESPDLETDSEGRDGEQDQFVRDFEFPDCATNWMERFFA